MTGKLLEGGHLGGRLEGLMRGNMVRRRALRKADKYCRAEVLDYSNEAASSVEQKVVIASGFAPTIIGQMAMTKQEGSCRPVKALHSRRIYARDGSPSEA
jgi:hypothetical protein